MTGFNVPELIKTTVHRLTHPKGYKDLITKYMQAVKKEKEKSGHQDSNGAVLSDIARQMGFDRIKPIQMYINKLVRKGQLPQMLAAELEKEGDQKQTTMDNQLTHSNESYEIGKDYANHTKEITPGETPSEKPVDSKTRAEQSAEKISAKDIQNWASASETIDKYKTRYGEDWEKELDEATNKMEERLKVQSFKQFNNSQGD